MTQNSFNRKTLSFGLCLANKNDKVKESQLGRAPAKVRRVLLCFLNRSGAATSQETKSSDGTDDSLWILQHPDSTRRPNPTRDRLQARLGQVQPEEESLTGNRWLFRSTTTQFSRSGIALWILLRHDTGFATPSPSSYLHLISRTVLVFALFFYYFFLTVTIALSCLWRPLK